MLSVSELLTINITTEIEKNRLFSGTVVEFKCAKGYRMNNSTFSENRCLQDGSWEIEFPECIRGSFWYNILFAILYFASEYTFKDKHSNVLKTYRKEKAKLFKVKLFKYFFFLRFNLFVRVTITVIALACYKH